MKTITRSLGALAVVLALAGCYWVGPPSDSGGVALSLAVPRGLMPPGYTGYFVRVTLYPAGGVYAEYWDGESEWNSVPSSESDPIRVTVTGSPVQLEGYDYYEVEAEPPSGSFTIPDVPAGKTYRLRVQLFERGVAYGDLLLREGVSGDFVVASGGVTPVQVDLYNPYLP